MEKKETVELKKESLYKFSIVALALLLTISIFTGGFSGKSTGEVVKEKLPAMENDPIDMNQLIEDDSVRGDKNAPVTIVEFSDYECPFCARFYADAYQQIKSVYIDTGKVKFVYRDFPLSFHQNAKKAAEAAECAGEQGMYFEMHDKLFENGVSEGVDSYKKYAMEIGLDQEQFDSCLDSGAMASEVQKDFMDGQKAGVKGTPAFIINGELISGAQPFSVFQETIDSFLN
jgi:protein-disulfide isomerase